LSLFVLILLCSCISFFFTLILVFFLTTQHRILAIDRFHLDVLPVHLCSLVELENKTELFYTSHQLVEAYPQKAVGFILFSSHLLLVFGSPFLFLSSISLFFLSLFSVDILVRCWLLLLSDGQIR
jgi:hypothetical protein